MYENLAVFTPSMRESDADERWIFPGKHVYNFRWGNRIDIYTVRVVSYDHDHMTIDDKDDMIL